MTTICYRACFPASIHQFDTLLTSPLATRPRSNEPISGDVGHGTISKSWSEAGGHRGGELSGSGVGV